MRERLWGVKCGVISIVVGTLGTITTRLSAHLKMLDINLSIQKSAILGTARILSYLVHVFDRTDVVLVLPTFHLLFSFSFVSGHQVHHSLLVSSIPLGHQTYGCHGSSCCSGCHCSV